ncbi:MAG: DNA alkylation repair protein [Neobacillus sp.]
MEKIVSIITLFETHRNPENAEPMEKYMRNLFPFLGIKTPERRKLVRQFFNETGILKEPFNKDLVSALWKMDEREYQYAALDYIERSLKKVTKDDLPFFEKLMTTKSWWDTVDMISPKAVGEIAGKSPEVIEETIDGWAVDENFWLKRASILFQLKYKQRTNEELLYRYILQNASSKEFFIQKAIGWALREYSKTNPDSVKQFISSNLLAPLSVREGSKYVL